MNTAQEPKPVSDDKLWDQAQKDRAAAKANDAPVETPTPTPGASATPAPKPAEPAQAPAAAAPQQPASAPAPKPEDPLAGLPEPTRKLIEGLQSNDARRAEEQAKLRRELDTAHGRIGSLTQDLQKSREELTTLKPGAEAGAAVAKAADAEKEAAELKRVEAARAKLADLLDPEELDLVLPLPKPKPAQPAAQPAAAAPSPAPAAAAPAPAQQPAPSAAPQGPTPQVLAALHEAMELVHPGWTETRATPEFKAWFNTAPAEVKALANSWAAADTKKIFDEYKQHQTNAAEVARLEEERSGRLRRGEGPQSRGSPARAGAPVSEDALWDQAKRDRASQRASSA